MAQNVVINGVTYSNVPSVKIPKSTSGDADFYDISDATLDSAGKILDGVVAYGSDGTKYTGFIATKTSADLTVSGSTVTAPAGYYALSASKAVATGRATPPTSISATSATIGSTTANTLTLAKTISVTPVVSAGYISAGTAGDAIVSLTATVTTKSATTYTPTTSNQTIANGTYLTGTQTIKGDTNLVAGNIKSGVSIFGVAGTLTSAIVSQDSTTKVLSIS